MMFVLAEEDKEEKQHKCEPQKAKQKMNIKHCFFLRAVQKRVFPKLHLLIFFFVNFFPSPMCVVSSFFPFILG